MKERIVQLLSHLDLTSAQFADIIGVQRSSISHILSGRNKPSFDFIQKILIKYPEINADWLLTGRGNLLNTVKSENTENNVNSEPELFANSSENSALTAPLQATGKISIDTPLANENITEKMLNTSQVTNVNSIKTIILVYEDNTFKVLSGR